MASVGCSVWIARIFTADQCWTLETSADRIGFVNLVLGTIVFLVYIPRIASLVFHRMWLQQPRVISIVKLDEAAEVPTGSILALISTFHSESSVAVIQGNNISLPRSGSETRFIIFWVRPHDNRNVRSEELQPTIGAIIASGGEEKRIAVALIFKPPFDGDEPATIQGELMSRIKVTRFLYNAFGQFYDRQTWWAAPQYDDIASFLQT